MLTMTGHPEPVEGAKACPGMRSDRKFGLHTYDLLLRSVDWVDLPAVNLGQYFVCAF